MTDQKRGRCGICGWDFVVTLVYVGSPLQGVEEVARERTARKLDSIIENPSHTLHQGITLRWSKRGNDRFTYPSQTHARLSKSFVPTALRLYNETHNGRLARIR